MSASDEQRFRMRAISIASSAFVVASICAVLVLASRVRTDFDVAASEGVYATVEQRPTPPRERSARPPALPLANPSAAPTPTPLPVDRALLARALSCFSRRAAERPPNCPPMQSSDLGNSAELPAGGDFARPEELDLNRVYTPAELRTIVTPSCRRDGGGGACIPIGPRPPPPSRSAEEVCEAEGIGPCRPPPFRPEDVQRRQHTD